MIAVAICAAVTIPLTAIWSWAERRRRWGKGAT